jgi:hypothetical protein
MGNAPFAGKKEISKSKKPSVSERHTARIVKDQKEIATWLRQF